MKRTLQSLVLISIFLMLAACQSEPEVETKHYELNADGIAIQVAVTHLGESLQVYTAETALPFTAETYEELEDIVKQSETRYADYQGVTFTSEFFDDHVVTRQSLNFDKMNVDELTNDPTFSDFANGTITFSQLEDAFKKQGFKEVSHK